MSDLTKMIGPGGPKDIAICSAAQVGEWRAYGYVTEAEAAEAEEARLKAEADAKAKAEAEAAEAAKAKPGKA